jgi:hypothetical protein
LSAAGVVVLGDGFQPAVEQLLARYGMTLAPVAAGDNIPASWWGEREAGLRGAALYARADTPLHSVLHEACHYVCMSPQRRAALDTDAGGGYDEENGVCYLQVLLADSLPGFGRARMFADMDAWGYSFRLGAARAWFEQDASDALQWLQRHDLVDAAGRPTWRLRAS